MAARKTDNYFPRVQEAREALAAKAVDILEAYVKVVKEAAAAGDYEVATKSLQWLMEHMPQEQLGGMIDVGIDKPKVTVGSVGPAINIGFAIGGITKPPLELPPAEVIDAEDEDDVDES